MWPPSPLHVLSLTSLQLPPRVTLLLLLKDLFLGPTKGKGIAVETFVNNPDYTFKKMTGVIPRGDLKAFLQVNLGALY